MGEFSLIWAKIGERTDNIWANLGNKRLNEAEGQKKLGRMGKYGREWANMREIDSKVKTFLETFSLVTFLSPIVENWANLGEFGLKGATSCEKKLGENRLSDA